MKRSNISISGKAGSVLGVLVLLAAIAGLANCGGGGGGGGPTNVNPGDPSQVMSNLLLKVGGTAAAITAGSPPASSASAAAPKAAAGNSNVVTTTGSGSTVSIPISFQAGSAMAAIFAKIGGANSFFMADNPVGGKVAKAVPVSGGGQSFVITLQLKNNFAEGTVCFGVSGIDGNQLVSNVVDVCTELVNQITTPANDQPAAGALVTDLVGTWVSPCQDYQTANSSGSARVGFSFNASQAYSEFLETWGAGGCSGNPVSALGVVGGTFQVGQAPEFVPAVGVWATTFDFIPGSSSAALGANPCFNLLRFQSGDPDRFYLGVPVGFTISGETDSPGSCVSVPNRPTFLSGNVPFTPGSELPQNIAPVANAGPDQSVNPGVTVHLSAAGSSDADGTIASYAWSQTAGPAVTLNGANTSAPSFTAPAVNGSAVLRTFLLTVTDNSGGAAQDSVNVTVTTNIPPVANAGPDQVRQSQATVQLDGSQSSDADGTITYAWVQTTSIPLTLQGADTATPSFTAPTVNSGSLPLTFQLTVTDNDGATAQDSVNVTIVHDVAPLANAGPDQSVKSASSVQLTGAGSSDPDGTVASYAWTQTGGPAVTLAGASSVNPTFTAPTVTGAPAMLTFQLVVTDNLGLQSAPDSVNVTVSKNQPPVANAGPDLSVEAGDTVQVSGAASSDPDGTIVSYQWQELTGPSTTLTGADTATLSFTAPNNPPKTFTFRLTVTDDDGATGTDTVTVSVVTPFALTYGTTNFTDNKMSFTFVIHGNQPIGNWFVDQGSASPNPQGEIFNETVATGQNCTGGPQGAAIITCNDKFVGKYLGPMVASCSVASTSTATLSADTAILTFNLACAGGTSVSTGTVGIGQSSNMAAPPYLNHQARGATTGHLLSVTGSCSANGGCP